MKNSKVIMLDKFLEQNVGKDGLIIEKTDESEGKSSPIDDVAKQAQKGYIFSQKK